MRLDAVLRGDIPDFDQRILAGGYDEDRSSIIIGDTDFAAFFVLRIRCWVDEMQCRDLVLMTPELEEANLSYEIPDNDVGVFRTAC